MTALHGKEDPMLEATAFPRLLRQAHDAEIADVRKISDEEYEVVGRGMEPGPASPARSAEPDRPDADTAVPAAAGEAVAQRGGMRFRRGARIGASASVIPMIGVVQLDDEKPEESKKPRAPRKKATKTTAEDPAAPPKKGGSRTRKKVEG
jgi:hypothetical protein